jgi:DNA primase
MAIQRLLNCTESEAWAAVRAASGGTVIMPNKAVSECLPRRKALRTPLGLAPLSNRHKNYLSARGFNPDKLEYIWNLQGLGQNTDKEYRWRIFIPVTYQGKMVTFQCRAISDSQMPPYLACSAEREVRPIKECLYGLDQVEGDEVLVVEGVTDVWRLGPGAVATFGTSWIQAQANLLKRFKKVFIGFDPEDEAQQKARELAYALMGIGPEVELIDFEAGTDPGDMSDAAARKVMMELGLR